jgi:hypothetical protein
MKKLMTLMLGMSLAFGAVTATFAQTKDDTNMKGKKKGGKKKGETPKKDGSGSH